MDIWDQYKPTFTKPNELHNGKLTEGIFEGTGITALDLDQDPQSAMKNKISNFDEADLQKSYAWAQGKDEKTVTIAGRSHHIGKKFQARTKTMSPQGLNIAPANHTSITSGLTQEAAEYDDASLLGGESLALDPEGERISLLGDDASLTGEDVYPPGDESLRVSTATGHTTSSKVKHATSLITQEFNAAINK